MARRKGGHLKISFPPGHPAFEVASIFNLQSDPDDPLALDGEESDFFALKIHCDGDVLLAALLRSPDRNHWNLPLGES